MRDLLSALIAACGLILMLLPMAARRDRAAWAKRVFVLTGGLALVSAATSVAPRCGRLGDADSTIRFLWYGRTLVNGAVIGLIVALALSGELQGHKKPVASG